MVAINSAESNRVSIRTLKEVTWATTPASGVTKELRYTSASLAPTKETKTSEEIRADRMVSAIVEVGAATGGDISGEFSAGTWDEFYEAFVLGAWSKSMTMFRATGVTITSATELTITGKGDLTDYFTAGDYIKLEGCVDPLNNRYAAITGVAASVLTFAAATFQTGDANSGTPYCKLLDAEDVIAVDTAITFGQTTTGFSIEGGAGIWTAPVAAGELRKGQKIFVEGLGYGTQTVTFVTSAATAGETVTISDGTSTIIFEFGTASTVTAGNVAVAPGAAFGDSADNLVDAIMGELAKNNLQVSATATTGVCTLVNYLDDTGSLAETGTNISVGGATFSAAVDVHGFYTIDSVDNDEIITVEGLTDDANGGGATIVVKGSHLRNDGDLTGIIKQSFTVEVGFTDIAKYFVYRGQRVGSFTQNVAAGELVTVDWSLMGNEVVTGVSDTLGGAGYTPHDSTAGEPFNATANVGAIYKDGVALTTAIQSIEISGEANLREQRAVSSKFAAGIGYGRFTLTGNINAYFETLTLFNHFINHDTISLAWDFSDSDKTTYWYTVPALNITSDPVAPEGIDQDIMENMDWEAKRDASLNTQFMIDRFSSTRPATMG